MTPQQKSQSDFDYKMVIVTRSDLSLSTGKLAAQVSHAAVACTLLTKKHKPKWFSKWQREGAKKVVVKVEKSEDFLQLKEKAEELGIIAIIVTDAGHTEIPEGTETVLGIGPAPSNLIDQVTGELSIL
jgi:PTH2 family peptidyl-tRNA hydrolase